MRLAIEADSIEELQRATKALAVLFEVVRSDEDLSRPADELVKRGGGVLEALQTLLGDSVALDRSVAELLSVEGLAVRPADDVPGTY